VFGAEWEEVTGDWRILHSDVLGNVLCLGLSGRK